MSGDTATGATAVVSAFHQTLYSTNVAQAAALLAEDLSVHDFFPHQSSKKAFMRGMSQLMASMSMITAPIITIQVKEDAVHVAFQVRGTHTAPLDFSFMRLPILPASHQMVVWPVAHWEYSVLSGKIVRIQNCSATESGMPGILKSFGLLLPVEGQV
jgi:hypothetical protein